ncbi:MAG: (2Fe-2S)-binding protein [Candidatus Glassbacteria bacterium]|nr:(2Fe-2S)-binding protein [Candidatus Glassbacteria bacterium]
MSDTINFTIDGKDCQGKKGQSIIQAADDNGVYIPRLCYHPELTPGGSCRICTVNVNGRQMAACTTPVAEGMLIFNDTPELQDMRRALVEMLFIEGNHFCPSCERSGNCELQALAYRLGIMAPRFPYMFPQRTIDASHPQIYIDGNRCIQCGRCVRAAEELDGKNILGFIGRGPFLKIKASSSRGLAGVEIKPTDRCVQLCPVGTIIVKETAYRTPIGERQYDKKPIGAEIEGSH